MTKKLIIEFEVDDSLTIDDLCNFIHDQTRDMRLATDKKFDRIGNGKRTCFHDTIIRFNGFERVNFAWRNGIGMVRRRRKNS